MSESDEATRPVGPTTWWTAAKYTSALVLYTSYEVDHGSMEQTCLLKLE